jgi:hypothetical protein
MEKVVRTFEIIILKKAKLETYDKHHIAYRPCQF